MDLNGRPLEIEDKVNLTLLINKLNWYSTEPKTKKYVKGYGFLSFATNLSDKYAKHLLDTATKTGLNASKTASKKVVNKPAEGTDEFIGNTIADKIVKPKPPPNANSRNVKEIVIPPEKREEILKKLRQVL